MNTDLEVVETGEVIHLMTAEEASSVTTQIVVKLDAIADNYQSVMPLIRDAITRQAHAALGYLSPGAYVVDRFGSALSRLGADLRREVVRELSEAGLSTRAIAPVVGVSQKTVVKDRQVIPGVSPDPIVSEEPDASEDSWPDDEPALTEEECEALDRAPELAEAIEAPPRITGIDGKSYPKPPKPKAPNRHPLADDASRALDDVWLRTGKLAAITVDDRFRSNRQAILDREGPKVLAALRDLSAFATAVKTGITPETEQARDNWAASLTDVIKVLADLNNQSPEEEK